MILAGQKRYPSGFGTYMTRIQLLLGWLFCAAAAWAQDDYARAIGDWRHGREVSLKSEDGWLTVVGLFWLREGENHFGADPSNEIVLPSDSAPARAGVIELRGGKTRFRAEAGTKITLNGRSVSSGELKSDGAGEPDTLRMGTLSLFVIQRGNRYGIRLKDTNSKFRREFSGLKWYPASRSYRVDAKWIPYSPPRKLAILNIIGVTEQQTCPGYAEFSLGGQPLRLYPVLEGPDESNLFFIFKDLTSGKGTYPAGRFLYSDRARNGKVILDFNKAYSPPCAFTPYATCPLPPKQNHLSVKVEAGEQYTAHH